MRPRISIRGSVHPSVGPSICWSVRYASAKTAVRSYIETKDQPICFDSLPYYLVISLIYLSICLHICHVTWSIHAETQTRRIVARSGLLFLFLQYFSFSASIVFVRTKKSIGFSPEELVQVEVGKQQEPVEDMRPNDRNIMYSLNYTFLTYIDIPSQSEKEMTQMRTSPAR